MFVILLVQMDFSAVLVCILALFGQCLSAASPSFEACESGPLPVTVAVNPCEQIKYGKKVGCMLLQGTQVKVEAAFVAPFDSNALEIISTAVFRGHELHLPDSGNNACLHLNPGCPMVKGRVYIFNYRFDIMRYYPMGELKVKIMVRERKTRKIAACAKMTVLIAGDFKV